MPPNSLKAWETSPLQKSPLTDMQQSSTDVSARFVKITPQSYRPDYRAGGSLLLKFMARTIYSFTIVKR